MQGQKIFVSMTWDILGHKYPFYNYSTVIKFYWTKLHLNSRNNANTPTFFKLKLTCLTYKMSGFISIQESDTNSILFT